MIKGLLALVGLGTIIMVVAQQMDMTVIELGKTVIGLIK